MAQLQGGAPCGAFAQPMAPGGFVVAPNQMQATAIPFQPGMAAFLPRNMAMAAPQPQQMGANGSEEKYMIMAMPMANQQQWQQGNNGAGAWDARQPAQQARVQLGILWPFLGWNYANFWWFND
eukprot:Skav209548  [mRNA]  locus=scaffold2497:214014:215187:+ [translate_table: standard]